MIKIITYPDIVYGKNKKIMLLSVGKDIETSFQNDFLPEVNEYLHVYYASFENKNEVVQWLLTVFSISDTVIVNLDNIPLEYHFLMGYFLAFSKTYYLTNGNALVYNMMNANRIYNLDFLLENYRTNKE